MATPNGGRGTRGSRGAGRPVAGGPGDGPHESLQETKARLAQATGGLDGPQTAAGPGGGVRGPENQPARNNGGGPRPNRFWERENLNPRGGPAKKNLRILLGSAGGAPRGGFGGWAGAGILGPSRFISALFSTGTACPQGPPMRSFGTIRGGKPAKKPSPGVPEGGEKPHIPPPFVAGPQTQGARIGLPRAPRAKKRAEPQAGGKVSNTSNRGTRPPVPPSRTRGRKSWVESFFSPVDKRGGRGRAGVTFCFRGGRPQPAALKSPAGRGPLFVAAVIKLRRKQDTPRFWGGPPRAPAAHMGQGWGAGGGGGGRGGDNAGITNITGSLLLLSKGAFSGVLLRGGGGGCGGGGGWGGGGNGAGWRPAQGGGS